jgi:hypothetical protein
MTEAPGGKLAWGQGANYDAADDRAVITAVTGGRIGLVRPVYLRAGAGLNVHIEGGWVGVASCNDFTSAVIGTRDELVVQARPGPATGSRTDYIWADTNPDDGTFELRVISTADAAVRPGIPLATITAPANSNTAGAMTLRPVDAAIERRLMSYSSADNSNVYSSTSYGASLGQSLDSNPVVMEPGQWYRVRYQTSSAQLVAAPSNFRENGECYLGIGYRTAGQAAVNSVLARQAALNFSFVGGVTPGYQQAQVEWVFRHSVTDSRFERVFSGRMWARFGGCQFRVNGVGFTGNPQMLTVEDVGS